MPSCPDCGSEIISGSEFCNNCGKKLPATMVTMEPATPAQQQIFSRPPSNAPSSPMSKSRDTTKIALAVVIVVLLVFLGYSFTQGMQSNPQLSDLENRLTSMSANFSALQSQYNTLYDNYNSLLSQYNDLENSYQMSSNLHIGATLETYYDYVRAHITESGTTLEADAAAHDAGDLHWPGLEDASNYTIISGANEFADRTAYRITSQFLLYANIQSGDSDVVKIDKILHLITSHVTYENRSNTEILFPTEVITFGSGDCTGFSCLAACLFEEVGIKSAIGYFTNSSQPTGHAMVLVHLQDLGAYANSYYPDLTSYGLTSGKWIVIEPQDNSLNTYSNDLNWVDSWSLNSASEVPYGP